jgi:MraZ protein
MDYFFNGNATNVLDKKHRIRVPAKMRAMLGDNYCITIGTDNCLWILPSESVEQLRKNLANLDLTDPRARAVKREVLGNMFSPEEDAQGRLVLPPTLVKYAELKKEVLFIGQDQWIEMWNPDKLDGFKDKNPDTDIAQFKLM